MKRSRRVTLILSGGLLGGVLAGCDSRERDTSLDGAAGNVTTFTNNHYVQGLGYYHAPYRAWYAFPYNHFSPGRGYYAGDRWRSTPDSSLVLESTPTASALAEARTKGLNVAAPAEGQAGSRSISRGGFGSSSWRGIVT